MVEPDSERKQTEEREAPRITRGDKVAFAIGLTPLIAGAAVAFFYTVLPQSFKLVFEERLVNPLLMATLIACATFITLPFSAFNINHEGLKYAIKCILLFMVLFLVIIEVGAVCHGCRDMLDSIAFLNVGIPGT